MNNYLKNSMLNGELILFIGAGVSKGSLTQTGEPIPDGYNLAKSLCAKIELDYNGESLSKVYGAAEGIMGEKRLLDFLEENFKYCQPSDEYKVLVSLPFKRIYSLNIDDCIEQAFYRNIKDRKLEVKNRNDFISEYTYLNNKTTLIKLNGDINRPDLDFIFSSQEYARNLTKNINWYSELAKDMHTYTFLFIGTKLDEPLLEYYLELFKKNNNVATSTKSYVITPSATEIERISLLKHNLEHINGKLSDFIAYINNQFGSTLPTYVDVVGNLNPYTITDDKQLEIVSKITPVSLSNIVSKNQNLNHIDNIRDFYRGFKPTWQDIVDNVPATLKKTKDFTDELLSKPNKSCDLFIIHGVAGCGKSTALKQVSLHLANKKENSVYFIDNAYENLNDIVNYLDSIKNKAYYICIDRIINNNYRELLDIIAKNKTRAIFVITENTALWERKAKAILEPVTTKILNISTIEPEDVDEILIKLKEFGNWTRLEKMSKSERRRELAGKASRQLLIGLLETTSGLGYQEIITKDFKALGSIDERNLLLLSSIAALENYPSNEETLSRALTYLNPEFNTSVKYLADNMRGILKYSHGDITTRHRVYSEKVFNIDKNSELKKVLLIAYINAFINYRFPIVQNLSKKEASIYKHLVNYKFLIRFLDNNKEEILEIYNHFEKSLENEGLFLLQYGLALRHFGNTFEAFEKLRVALNAYPNSPHIEHALAHQKLILASESKSVHNLSRENLFNEAKIALIRLSKVEAGSFKNDSYPIVTLSKGHINYLIYLNKVEESKKVAEEYFDNLKDHSDYHSDPYLKQIATELMNYNLFGTWKYGY